MSSSNYIYFFHQKNNINRTKKLKLLKYNQFKLYGKNMSTLSTSLDINSPYIDNTFTVPNFLVENLKKSNNLINFSRLYQNNTQTTQTRTSSIFCTKIQQTHIKSFYLIYGLFTSTLPSQTTHYKTFKTGKKLKHIFKLFYVNQKSTFNNKHVYVENKLKLTNTFTNFNYNKLSNLNIITSLTNNINYNSKNININQPVSKKNINTYINKNLNIIYSKSTVNTLKTKFSPYITPKPIYTSFTKTQLNTKHFNTRTFNNNLITDNIINKLNCKIKLKSKRHNRQILNTSEGVYDYVKSNSNKLTLNSLGLFLLRNVSQHVKIFKKLKYVFLFKIKKFNYTFLKPNQAKTIILKRKSTIFLYNSLTTKLTTKINTLFKQIFFKTITTNLYNYGLKNLFLNKQLSINNLGINFTNHSFKKPTNDTLIPRVKFKPGYQRLWRGYRSTFIESNGTNNSFTYQHQLTKYINRFLKKNNTKYLLNYELTLNKIVIYSRILPDYHTYNLFFNNNLVFLNGKIPTSSRINCVVNDFVQLLVSKWYYLFYR